MDQKSESPAFASQTPIDDDNTAREFLPDQSAPAVDLAATDIDLPVGMQTDDDAALDRAVEDAMSGVTEAMLSGDAAGSAPPTPDEARAGDLVAGRIANIGSQDVLIDFGAKMLGVMPRGELEGDAAQKVGDSIEVLITGEDKGGGLLTVSRKQARQESVLRRMKPGLVLEGVITGMNRGGLEINVDGLRGFIPASQVDTHFHKDISDLIGQTVRAEVTKFDAEEKNIVLSRRRVLAREEAQQRDRMIEELQVGQQLRGKVKNLAEYGAFIDLGGIDGLLHVSDMSWGRVNKPDDVVKVGDEVDVKIIKISKEKKKVSLSLKETVPNPWTMAGERYGVGTKVSGRVVRLANFGAFVELEPGLDALLPISEMSWTRKLRSPKEMVNEGDVIEASVISCEPDKERISLSLKALSGDPWSDVAQKYSLHSTVKGKVVRTTEFGAFVSLEEGIDGLIHISELSDSRVRAVTDKVKVGDEIEARVISIDPVNHKIGLSLRPPPREPTPEEIAQMKAEQAALEKRRNKKRRGGITIGWDQGLGALDPSKFAR